MLETTNERKKLKTMGYNTFHGALSREWIDRRY